MIKLSIVLLALFCLSFALIMLTPIAPEAGKSYATFTNSTIFNSGGNETANDFGNLIGLSKIFTDFGLTFGLTFIVAGFASSLAFGSFSIMFAFPIAIVAGLVNYFLKPLSYLSALGLAPEIMTFVISLFGVLIFLGIITFVRGDA